MSSTPQPLPERWQATTLMAPYLYRGKPKDFHDLSSRAELQVGRFVYDGENRLMRVTRYGEKLGGVVDLLISEKATFVLTGDYANPQCVAKLAHPYTVPGRTWQDPKSQPVCVGSHATAPTMEGGPKVDWWKQQSPVQEPGALGQAADWYWFDQKGYPTRTMFWFKHDGLPAVLGDYAFTNFYKFDEGNDIDLKKIAATCEGHDLPAWDDGKVNELERRSAAKPEENRAGKLIPGLSYQACAALDAKPPTWPSQIYMTSFSTAAKYATPKPITTSVYYRPGTPELRTRLHKGGDHAPFWSAAKRRLRQAGGGGPVWSDALLINQSSYGIDFDATQPFAQKDCARGPHTSLPGSPHEDWGVRGHCQCMGVLQDTPGFSPGRNTEIIACPLPLIAHKTGEQSGNTLFWMWYTIAQPMRPVVFLQSKPDVTIGTGLSLADYVVWRPQQDVDQTIFTAPADATCPSPPASEPVPPAPCMGCHNSSTNSASRR